MKSVAFQPSLNSLKNTMVIMICSKIANNYFSFKILKSSAPEDDIITVITFNLSVYNFRSYNVK